VGSNPTISTKFNIFIYTNCGRISSWEGLRHWWYSWKAIELGTTDGWDKTTITKGRMRNPTVLWIRRRNSMTISAGVAGRQSSLSQHIDWSSLWIVGEKGSVQGLWVIVIPINLQGRPQGCPLFFNLNRT